MQKWQKFAVLATVASTFALFGGCSINSLLRNVWTGFGLGIGGLPAGIVNDAIRGALGL